MSCFPPLYKVILRKDMLFHFFFFVFGRNEVLLVVCGLKIFSVPQVTRPH